MRIALMSIYSERTDAFIKCMKSLGHVTEFYCIEKTAIDEISAGHLDLVVVLDQDRFEACPFIRKLRVSKFAGLILAMARDNSAARRIETFSAGADQVAGPDATCEELAARVLSLLRYRQPTTSDHLCYEDLHVHPAARRIRRDDKELTLKGKPFELLEFFVRNPERVHSRQEIGESVWDQNFDIFSNVIDVTVSKVRAKIDRGFDCRYLQTVVGHGYMLRKMDAV